MELCEEYMYECFDRLEIGGEPILVQHVIEERLIVMQLCRGYNVTMHGYVVWRYYDHLMATLIFRVTQIGSPTLKARNKKQWNKN